MRGLAPDAILNVRAWGLSPEQVRKRFIRYKDVGEGSFFAPLTPALLSPASLVHTRASSAPLADPTLAPAALVHTRAQGALQVNPKIIVTALVHTRTLGAPSVSSLTALLPASLTRTRVLGDPGVTSVSRNPLIGQPPVNDATHDIVSTRGLTGEQTRRRFIHYKDLGEVGYFAPLTSLTPSPASLVRTRALGALAIAYGLSPASLVHTRTLGALTVAIHMYVSPASLVHGRVLGAPFANDGTTPATSAYRPTHPGQHDR